jgi:diguanylate cyclase (GGDEF)-like protein
LSGSELFDAVWQFVLVTGLSFVVLAIVTSMIRFYQLSNPADFLAATAVISGSTRFQARVAARLGTAYRLPHPFCLLVASGPAASPERRAHSLETLRRGVRQTDVVMELDDGSIGLLLDMPRRHVELVQTRLQAALAAEGGLQIGASSCPENGIRAQELLHAAQAATPATAGSWALAAPPSGTEPPPLTEDDDAALDQTGLVDKLTGVLRPERLRRVMPKFVARYRREGQPVSLIYLDVDYLERYNDHYGRAAGDEILRGVGLLLQHQVREDDLLGRVGDDDFVALLNCSTASAVAVANRLGNGIKRATFAVAGFTLKATVSGGVAGCPEHGRTATQIFDTAHAALLAARDRGRNLCLLFDPTMKAYHTASLNVDKF